jgi:hypothetical protein
VIGGRVLAPDALIDVAAGKTVYARVLVQVAVEAGIALAAPAGSLTQAWAETSASDQPFLELLTGRSVVVTDPLTGQDAETVGGLAAAGGGSRIGLAHAVHVAGTRGWPLVTGQDHAARAMNPALMIEPLP